MSNGKLYYWQRIIREKALIKACTFVVIGKAHFIELKASEPELNLEIEPKNLVLFFTPMEVKLKFGCLC